jgi:tRNA (guanine-N7-)-methyltransferase
MSEASERAGAFFGRRKGKKLRAGQDELVQKLLPAIRVVPGRAPSSQFPDRQARETWLEIGFGGGEHLAAQARARRDVNFVGCEPFVNGMAKLLAVIEHERLDNVRVWDDDVTDLLPTLPDASFDRVYILYPDPWPKRRQRKRRLVSDETIDLLARVMKPGAELRFASDIDDYIGWVLARALRSRHFRWTATRADDWRKPYEGWPGTRYEAKAIREGRVPSYLTFVRV